MIVKSLMSFVLSLFLLGCSCSPTRSPHVTEKPRVEIVVPQPVKYPVLAGPVGVVDFSDDVDDDNITAVIKEINIEKAVGMKGIILVINSSGGDVDAGMKLSKFLERGAGIPSFCVVDGSAESMAFYILQSCTVRLMLKRSALMVHQPIHGQKDLRGQQDFWISIAQEIIASTNAMAEHNVHRMSIDINEYKARTAGGRQWYMNWDDAMKYGAVDGIIDSVSDLEDLLNPLPFP